MVTPDQSEALLRLIADDTLFISRLMKIPNKDSVTVPLAPKPVQATFLKNMTGRDLVVKPSQIGLTTIVTALFLKRTITTPNTTSVIVAHEEFLTQRLLHRAQFMYDSIPAGFKPRADHQSSYEKRFPDINSVLYIGTARSQVFGRGEPIHNLLFSEPAFYVAGAAERVVIPALQRVPPTGTVVQESTPNGPDGYFDEEVAAALEGNSTFKLHVFYWFQEPDNHLPANTPLNLPTRDREGIESHYTVEEQVLVDLYHLTPAQMRWRRWKIREAKGYFWQEHVEGLDTCFLASGESYYDINRTSVLSRQCYPAPHSGPGGAEVWFPPETDEKLAPSYIIGVDPGQGKSSESVASVWRFDLDHPRHEARIAGLYDPTDTAWRVKALGQYYRRALVVVEANSHGLALVALLMDYPRLYRRTDIVSGIVSSQIGWLTTPKTKPFMLQELSRNLPNLETHDSELVRQIRGVREVSGISYTRIADDQHDAACLAFIGATGYQQKLSTGYIGSMGWRW